MKSAIKDNDIDAVAAEWAIRLDRGELSEAEQRELDAWLGSDSRRMGALVRAQAIWVDADHFAAVAPDAVTPSAEHGSRSRTLLAASIAAFLMIAVVAGVTSIYGFFSGREATDVGEIRRFTLVDGSAVVLNTSSVVQVQFAENERRVVLKRGEASFNVAHDKQRPFIVQARDVSVKAVGTSFTVRLRPSGVAVTVSEGVVEVLRPATTVTKERQLAGRNRQVVAPELRPMMAAQLTDRDVSRKLAWQEGLVIFDGERLAQAVSEMNRYSPTAVVIDDEQLANKSFVGVFRVGDVRSFVDAAAAAFDARVVEEDDALHLAR